MTFFDAILLQYSKSEIKLRNDKKSKKIKFMRLRSYTKDKDIKHDLSTFKKSTLNITCQEKHNNRIIIRTHQIHKKICLQ